MPGKGSLGLLSPDRKPLMFMFDSEHLTPWTGLLALVYILATFGLVEYPQSYQQEPYQPVYMLCFWIIFLFHTILAVDCGYCWLSDRMGIWKRYSCISAPFLLGLLEFPLACPHPKAWWEGPFPSLEWCIHALTFLICSIWPGIIFGLTLCALKMKLGGQEVSTRSFIRSLSLNEDEGLKLHTDKRLNGKKIDIRSSIRNLMLKPCSVCGEKAAGFILESGDGCDERYCREHFTRKIEDEIGLYKGRFVVHERSSGESSTGAQYLFYRPKDLLEDSYPESDVEAVRSLIASVVPADGKSSIVMIPNDVIRNIGDWSDEPLLTKDMDEIFGRVLDKDAFLVYLGGIIADFDSPKRSFKMGLPRGENGIYLWHNYF